MVEPLAEDNLADILDYMNTRDTELVADELQNTIGTVPWSSSTVLQAAHERLHSQTTGMSRDGASDIECRAHAVLYQPHGSLYPKS